MIVLDMFIYKREGLIQGCILTSNGEKEKSIYLNDEDISKLLKIPLVDLISNFKEHQKNLQEKMNRKAKIEAIKEVSKHLDLEKNYDE